MTNRKPRIAVIGSRGPCSAGGIETVCEKLYPYLAEDFDITIYSREPYVPKDLKHYKGIAVCPLPAINQKHMEAFSHSLLATLHAMCSKVDILHFHAQGPAVFSWIPRLLTPWKKVVFTCHGLDWQRAKWGNLATSVIRMGEWCSAHFPHERTAVSLMLKQYYERQYRRLTQHITNGVEAWPPLPANLIRERFELSPRKYLLFVGRLVPEKAVHEVISAYNALSHQERNGIKLVIAGGVSLNDAYAQQLLALSEGNPDIVFTDFANGQLLKELYANALGLVTASHLEGFSVALLEALANGLPAILSDIEMHREVCQFNQGQSKPFLMFFPTEDIDALRARMIELIQMPRTDWSFLHQSARVFASTHFQWKLIATQYRKLFLNLITPVPIEERDESPRPRTKPVLAFRDPLPGNVL